MGGNARTGASEAESFLRRRLDTDAVGAHIHAQGQIAAHLRDLRRELRRLRKHGTVQIADRIPFRS